MNLIYIGEAFRHESLPKFWLYTEKGNFCNWGFVNAELRKGGEIHIRQATAEELAQYQARLNDMASAGQAAKA